MPQKSVTWTIGKQKNIALIAHDSQKPVIIQWCEEHKDILKEHFLHGTGTTARMIAWVKENADILKRHFLMGTGTTAKLVAEEANLPVRGYNSGPLGGDQQIGAKIVEGKIDFVIFFSDPLTAQPHDPDVKALLRIAQVYDIPIANNKATADFLITSALMKTEYNHEVVDFKSAVAQRAQTL